MFSFFGGIQDKLSIDFFDELDEIILHHIVLDHSKIENLISPSYLIEKPYKDILMAIAKGDGKILNIFKRAKVSETVGKDAIYL